MLFRPSTVRDDRGLRIALTISESEGNARLKAHMEQAQKSRKQREQASERLAAVENKKPRSIWFDRLSNWSAFLVFGPAAILGAIGFVSGFVLAVSAPLIGLVLLLGFDWRTGIIATVCVAGVGGTIVGFRRRDTSRYERAKRWVAVNTCGACGYSLENLEVSSDNCLQCPECGAAWKKPGRGADCPGCEEPLYSLTVNSDGSAECSTCGHPFTFAPMPEECA